MTDITPDERATAADALDQEVRRLSTLVAEYNAVKSNTRNIAVRQMAEEGAAATVGRIRSLTALVKKFRGEMKP